MFSKRCAFVLFALFIVSNEIIASEVSLSDSARLLAESYQAPRAQDSVLVCSAREHVPFLDEAAVDLAPKTDRPCTPQLRRRRQNHSVGQAFGEIFSSAIKDILVLHKNLLTWNTFKIVSAIFPMYVGARMIDERIQRNFYDHGNRKNINQPPSWCHDVAKTSIAIPLVALGLNAFFSTQNDQRWTAQIMLLGMPFVIWTKKLVKQLKFDACLRPWHEKLTHGKERSFGGFPSGHMAQALYMAVLYGSQFGPRYSIPLGGIAAFIGTTFVACNRHYLSQIIAGGAFGSIYALAAVKLVQKKLTDHVKLTIAVDDIGSPTFGAKVTW